MSNIAQDWFGGLGGASASMGGNYLNPGTYWVKVEDVIRKTSQNPQTPGEKFFIIEVTILQVLASFPADANFPASNNRGERCSQVIKMSRGNTALSNIKNFLVAFLDVQEGDFSAEEWTGVAAELSDPTIPVEDRIGDTELIVVAGKTFTKANKPFSPNRWSPVPVSEARDA